MTMPQSNDPYQSSPATHDDEQGDPRKPWTSPLLRILPVLAGTKGGPQPKKPMEKIFYKTTS